MMYPLKLAMLQIKHQADTLPFVLEKQNHSIILKESGYSTIKQRKTGQAQF